MIEKKQTPSDSPKSSGEDEIMQNKNTNFIQKLKEEIHTNTMNMNDDMFKKVWHYNNIMDLNN